MLGTTPVKSNVFLQENFSNMRMAFCVFANASILLGAHLKRGKRIFLEKKGRDRSESSAVRARESSSVTQPITVKPVDEERSKIWLKR